MSNSLDSGTTDPTHDEEIAFFLQGTFRLFGILIERLVHLVAGTGYYIGRPYSTALPNADCYSFGFVKAVRSSSLLLV